MSPPPRQPRRPGPGRRPATGRPQPPQRTAPGRAVPEARDTLPMLRSPEQRRLALAIALLVIAVVLGIIAALLLNADYHRWQAGRTLHRMAQQRFQDPTVIPVIAQDLHAHAVPDIALPALDPSSADMAQRYRDLARQSRGPSRRVALTGARLAAILAGHDEETDGIAPPDRLLLDHMSGLMGLTGSPPPPLPQITADRLDAPQLAVLKSCYEAQVAAAWLAADIATLHDATQRLHAISPRHRCAPRLGLINALFDPQASRQLQRARNAISSLSEDNRVTMIRDLLQLARQDSAFQARNEDIIARVHSLGTELIPARHRDHHETIAAMAVASDPRALYNAAASSDDQHVVTIAAMRAAEHGDWNRVEDLLPRVVASHRRGLALASAINRVDPAALAELVEDADTRRALSPQLRAVRLASDRLSFHLINGTDTLDPSSITVFIDGQAVPGSQVDRLGSLFNIPVSRGTGRLRLRLAMEDRDIIAEQEIGR